MLICVGVFETWSWPRITCVIPSSMSSTGRGEVVGRPAVGADDHEVGELLVRELDPAAHGVVPADDALVGHAEADRALVLVGLALARRSRSASSRTSSIRSSWKVTGPSQSIPSQRSDSWICSTASATSRLVSVFSIRSRHSPPCWRAKSQLKRNVRTPPMWRKPVGLGAMRTRTLIGVAIVGRSSVQFGAHVSRRAGSTRRSTGSRRSAATASQVFTQSPRMWRPTAHKPEAIERFKARRAEAGIGGVVCHALYLCNLAAPDDAIYEKSVATMRATVDAAIAIEADAVIFHVGSHLGAGFDGRARAGRARRCEQILERCDGDTWLCMENSAGAGGTIGRSLDELAALVDAARPPPAARHLPRLVPPVRLRATT